MAENEVFITLLLQKKDLIFRLLRITNDMALTGEGAEENAEKFVGLVEAREKIIDQFKDLNSEIEWHQGLPHMTGEAVLLNQDIKEMTAQLVRLERDIRKKTLGIMVYLQQKIKDMNKRKRICGTYDAAVLNGSNYI